MVTKLDRLARSIPDARNIVDELPSAGSGSAARPTRGTVLYRAARTARCGSTESWSLLRVRPERRRPCGPGRCYARTAVRLAQG